MPKGNYGALRRLEPIKEDFGKIAREQEQVDAQKRAEQRSIDREKKADDRYNAEKRAELNKAKLDDLEKYRPIITGVDSWDKAQTNGIYSAIDRRGEIMESLSKDPFRNNPDSRDLELEYAKLGNYIKDVNDMNTFVKTYTTDLGEGVKSGELSASQNKGKLKRIAGIIDKKNITYDRDKNGNARLIFMDDDGKIQAVTKETLLNNELFSEHVLGFDKNAWVTNIKAASGLDKSVKEVGGQIITNSQLREEAIENIENEIESLIGTDEISARGKGIWEDVMKRDPKELNREELHDYLYDAALGATDKTYSKRTDYQKKNYELNASKNNPNKGTKSNISLMRNTTTGEPIKGYAAKGIGWATGEGYAFSTDVKDVPVGKMKISVQKYLMNEKGQIAFQGSRTYPEYISKVETGKDSNGNTKYEFKTIKAQSENFESSYFEEEELNLIAKAENFNNAHELKLHLQSLLNVTPEGGSKEAPKKKKTPISN